MCLASVSHSQPLLAPCSQGGFRCCCLHLPPASQLIPPSASSSSLGWGLLNPPGPPLSTKSPASCQHLQLLCGSADQTCFGCCSRSTLHPPAQPPPSQSRTVPVIQPSPPKPVHPHHLVWDTPSSSDGFCGHHRDPKLLPPLQRWVCQTRPHCSPGAHLRTTLCSKTLWLFPGHPPSCFTRGAAARPAAAQSLSQAQVPFLADSVKF